MSSGVHEQWTSKATISASPSHSKISWEKGKSPGWAAFDLKQRVKPGSKPEFNTDPYPPIHNTLDSMPPLEDTLITRTSSLRSFSSVVQLSTKFPVLLANGSCSEGKLTVGDSSSTPVNKNESKIKVISSCEKLKELHCWADEGLMKDILGAVNNDFDQASSLLQSMVSSACSDESKENNYDEQRSLSEKSGIDKDAIQVDESVSSYGTDIPELSSVLDNCFLDTRMKTSGEDIPSETTLSDNTIHPQLNVQYILTAPIEPEWEEDDVYLSHRKDAIRATRLASRHSRGASNAFMRGDRVSAQMLSLKAQEEWMAAEKLNAIAAEKILSIRNKGNDIWKLDLHGLHAFEAVSALQDHLWKIEFEVRLSRSVSPIRNIMPRAGTIDSSPESIKCLGSPTKADKVQRIFWQRPSVLQVVTGTGNHSRGQVALPTAVRSFLVENGYRFDEPRPGVIDVRPKFRHKISSAW